MKAINIPTSKKYFKLPVNTAFGDVFLVFKTYQAIEMNNAAYHFLGNCIRITGKPTQTTKKFITGLKPYFRGQDVYVIPQ